MLTMFKQIFTWWNQQTYSWMHYMNNKIENNHNLKKYDWQKEHLPNQTGSNNSYHPKKYYNGIKKKYKSWKN